MAFVRNAEKTWPSADSDLLMAAASTSLCPVASVLEILSEPAKSTRVSVPRVMAFVTLSVPWSRRSRRRCERELLVFILVAPTERFISPKMVPRKHFRTAHIKN